METLLINIPNVKIDKVVGVESRGFFYATLLVQALGTSFVALRKPNKLPFKTIDAIYDLAYGSDSLHMHTDAIKK